MKLDYWEIRPYMKMNSKWIKDICKSWKYKTSRRHGLYALWILSEQYFFDKANEIKNKQICRVKKTFKKMKRCPTLCVCVFLISCVWLCDPMDCSPQGSSVHGISWQEQWSGLPFPPAGDLLNTGIEPASPVSPALQVGSLLLSH